MASCGRTASAWNEVSSASRPNSVVNHGTPAAMYRSSGPGPSLMSRRRSPADRRIARLNSSLSVRISANPCFHARYEPATASSSTFGGFGNSTASGSVRPARPCATGELPSVGSGASRSVVHASQRSSRASPGRSSQCHVSRTQPAFAEPATSGSTGMASAHGSLNTRCVPRRTSSRPS